MKNVYDFISLMRPKQWIKNFFIFGALVFSKNIFNIDAVTNSIICFILFCAISSSVYIFNDIIDVDRDRQHPQKCNRPIAKGTISIPKAIAFGILISIICLLISFRFNKYISIILLLYLINNALYSLKVKNVVILDAMSIAFGFLLRVIAGAVSIDVTISSWILLCTFFISLFLGLGKRRQEIYLLKDNASDHRRILQDYSVEFIDHLLDVITACTIMSYAVYTFTAYKSINMMLTIPFVVYGVFRYKYLVHMENRGENPTELVLTDKWIIVDVMLWVVASVTILFDFC